MKKIKYLHIIRPSKELSYPIIKMIDENFSQEEHRFLVLPRIPVEECKEFLEFSNVNLFLKGKTRVGKLVYFIKQLNSAESIIFHGIYWPDEYLLFFNIFSWYFKKMVWIAWGMDLYNWKTDVTKLKGYRLLMARIRNRLAYRARMKINRYASVFPPDGNVMKNTFNHNAKVFDLTNTPMDFEKKIKDNCSTNKDKKYINIMVAHSANVWNNHKEILDSLVPYRYERIRLYITLSTGANRSYAREVAAYAKLLFGKKAICIYKRMNLDNYIKLLASMDIAIFKLHRQAALGNIMKLLYMNKKVYLPSDTVMYDFFKGQGCDIQDFKLVGKIKFEELVEPVSEEHSIQYIKSRVEHKNIIGMWEYLFRNIEKPYSKRKYLHIMTPSQETYDYIAMINTCFDKREHEFLFMPGLASGGVKKLVGMQGLTYSVVNKTAKDTRRELEKKIEDFQYIFFHNISVTQKQMEYLSSYKKYSSKIFGDVSLALDESQKRGRTNSKTKELRLQKQSQEFQKVLSENSKKIEKIIKEPSVKVLKEEHLKAIDNLLQNNKAKKEKKIAILVGLSGKNENNHMGILRSLTPYRYQNIKIYVDLTQGNNAAYMAKVKNYAIKLFGEKVSFINRNMENEKRIKFWNYIDIVVLRLYNCSEWDDILKILYLDKKLYLLSDTVMYDAIANRGGEIYDSSSIYKTSYAQFVEKIENRNSELVGSIIKNNTLENKWKGVFETLEGK